MWENFISENPRTQIFTRKKSWKPANPKNLKKIPPGKILDFKIHPKKFQSQKFNGGGGGFKV